MNFKHFEFHPDVESGIEKADYHEPTAIQSQCIPIIRKNRDLMGLAQTGTGKTAAFVLPILERLMGETRKRIRALIIAPTRELAEQTHGSIGLLGAKTKLKSVTVYGGTKTEPQVKKLRSGADIVVACPGRLIDLMGQGVIDLSDLEVLVIDEADRMFDMGFLPDIRKIMKRIPEKRQTLLFSATMPDDIRSLAREILRDPVTIQVGESAPVATVSHALYPVESHRKTALLMKILEKTETESVLVFTRTKDRTTRVARQMKKAGFNVASLQGDLSQNQRQEALDGFRNGKYRVLVATDIAARGIDVSRISHVVNYDMPDTADAYIHRIGRTGRAERTGTAFTFVTLQDRAFVWTLERILGETIERRTLDDFDYALPVPVVKTVSRRRKSRGTAERNPSASPRENACPPPAVGQTPGFSNAQPFLSSGKSFFGTARFKSRRTRVSNR